MPIIAVTTDCRDGAPAAGPNSQGRIRPTPAQMTLNTSIVAALTRFGAHPILIPPTEGDHQALFDWILAHTDGVVLTGGHHDIDPQHYGEAPTARLDRIEPSRNALELGLAQACFDHDHPCLGICGGMQAMAVALGGTLHQDIKTQLPLAKEHEQPTDPAQPWHRVAFHDGTLQRGYGTSTVEVNSTHHQAIKTPGPKLEVVGRAPDGIAEAIEARGKRFYLGVQWHPEVIDPTPYRLLVEASAGQLGRARLPT